MINRFYGRYVGAFELTWLPLFCDVLVTVEVIVDPERLFLFQYPDLRLLFFTTNKHCELKNLMVLVYLSLFCLV